MDKRSITWRALTICAGNDASAYAGKTFGAGKLQGILAWGREMITTKDTKVYDLMRSLFCRLASQGRINLPEQ